jgi:hypothetical protein
MGLSRNAPYPAHLAPAPLAFQKLWPYYTGNAVNSSALLAGLGMEWDCVGEIDSIGGNSFMYVKAAAALAQGQLVSFGTPTASTVTAAGSSTKTIVWAAGGLTVDAEIGNILYIANSTSSGGGFTIRKIISNTATTITFSRVDPSVASKPDDQNALELAATNGNVAIIIRPYQVIVNTATTVPVGVVLGTVTDTYYTIIQTKGLALVQTVGNGTATAVGKPAVGSAAGVAIGSAADAANLFNGPGGLVALSAYSAAGPGLTPFYVNFKGNF